MALQWSNAQGTITQDDVNLVNKSIDDLWNRRDVYAGVLEQFFDVENIGSGNGLTWVEANVGSEMPMPRINQDTEALPYAQPAPGYTKTYRMVNYRLGVRVTDTIMRTERFGKIMFMVSGLIKAGMRHDEYQRAAIFNSGFTGTAGSDSLPLYYDSHPHENPEQGTWDNLTTGALTTDNLHAGRLLARKMTNAQGDPEPVLPMKLLIGPDLERVARELVTSTLDAETNLNTRTVLIGSLELVVSPYLTSTTQWQLVGDLQGPDKGLREARVMDWEMADNKPANADIKIDKRVKAIKVFGFSRSKNLVGSTGA